MTTPDLLADVPLPYGVVATSVEGDRVLHPRYLKLPEGVNTVQVTWTQDLRLNVALAPISSHSSRRNIAEVPAGTGRRTVLIPGVGVPAGETQYLSLLCDTSPPGGSQATIQIITMPLQS